MGTLPSVNPNDLPDWLEPLSRFGFAVKGVVYATLGILAAKAAFGSGGQVGGSKETVQAIGAQPFGQVLLAIVGAGLIGYAAYRFAYAAVRNDKDWYKRAGSAGSGVMHLALSAYCWKMLAGGGSGGSSGKETLVGRVLTWPGGSWIIAAVGVGIAAVAAYQIHKGATTDLQKELETHEMSAAERTWTVRLGRAGLIVRGVVFGVIAAFTIKAGLTADPSQVKGVGGALAELGNQGYGMALLGVVAIGLAMYGAFQLANARYRRLDI